MYRLNAYNVAIQALCTWMNDVYVRAHVGDCTFCASQWFLALNWLLLGGGKNTTLATPPWHKHPRKTYSSTTKKHLNRVLFNFFFLFSVKICCKISSSVIKPHAVFGSPFGSRRDKSTQRAPCSSQRLEPELWCSPRTYQLFIFSRHSEDISNAAY